MQGAAARGGGRGERNSGDFFLSLSSQGAQADYPGSLVSLGRAKAGNSNVGV